MKIRFFTTLLITAVMFFTYNVHAQTPDASSIWIKAYGQSPALANMRFGNRIGNTFGLDTAASYPPEYREQEPPPANVPDAPPGFECLWKKIRFGQFGSYYGLLDRDYRDFSTANQKDTFKLGFAQYDNDTVTISFKWPDPSYLSAHCDSLFLKYNDPDSGTITLNMFERDTLTLPKAGTRGIALLSIYKTGVHLVETGVDDSYLPLSLSLSQNYPNPFNPTTSIQYAVASIQYISIKIYDVLGREIATLVNEVQDAGLKTVHWDATNVPSGVYFYRLQARPITGGQAGTFVDVKKMILIK
jgi:hypothetical protein